MKIVDAKFEKSGTRRAEWPKLAGVPEIALCGRSNVGKSSLLNSLLGRHGLARVSRTPGRTRLLNFFSVRLLKNSGGKIDLSVADLPGFGYAAVNRAERQLWRTMMQEYLADCEALCCVVMLFDGRRVLDKRAAEHLFDEIELVRYLESLGRAVIAVITKADKLSKHERKPAAAALTALIGLSPVVYSSQSGEGHDALWGRILAVTSQRPAEAGSAAELSQKERFHEGDPL